MIYSFLAIGTRVENIEGFYLCFFARLFSKIRGELEKCHATQQKGAKALADWWSDHLRQPNTRRELYSSVVDGISGVAPDTVSLMSFSLVYVPGDNQSLE
jgi:hypothetical protein